MGFCIYKGAAFCCGCLYWFHQWRIPRHTCRFYLLLAGAVEERQGIAIPYPSPTPLLTPLGNPLRRGISAAAVDRDIGSLYPVQTVHPHFDVMFGCFVFGLKSFAFQKITLGIGSFVFHWWWDGLFVPAATWCFAFSFVGFARNTLRGNR